MPKKKYSKNTPKPERKPMSPEHKAALAEGRRKAAEARRIKAEEEAAKAAAKAEQEDIIKAVNNPQMQNGYDESRIIFRPNPGPQTTFLAAPEQEVLYGGAAGGGKTFALLADVLRGVSESDYVALILRRTNDELREIIQKSKEIFPQMDRGARWSEKKSEWTFSTGARIWMSYLDRDDDVKRYQGQSFSYIAMDELTHWPTPYPWTYLSSRLRTTNTKITPYMRATSNPGGVGHAWVKKMFVDPAIPGQPFWAKDIDTGLTMVQPDRLPNGSPNPDRGKPLFQRRFIPAKLTDNPYLMATNYMQSLMALPEDQRRALLDGDWDVAEGAAFPEFRRSSHVVMPFELDNMWHVFRACDYGYGSWSSVLYLAVARNEQIFVVDEIYEHKMLASDLADVIKEKDKEWGVSYGILDSSCWHKRGDIGPSIAEILNAKGLRFRPADRSKGSRASGKQRIHELLKEDEFLGEPKLQIFNTCKNLIMSLSSIPLDDKNPEDVDTDFQHDHPYDALRYGLMSRPKSRNLGDFGPKSPNRSSRPRRTVFGHGY